MMITSGSSRTDARRLIVWFVVGVAIAASFYGWLCYGWTYVHPGRLGPLNYQGVGTDWMVYHAVARSILDGHPSTIEDGFRLTAFVNQSYGPWIQGTLGYRAWIYPPSFLLVVVPFGVLDFFSSYLLFQILTATGLAISILAGSHGNRRAAEIVALGALVSPAAAINVMCGQNAFLIAACIVAGVRMLQRRPLLAGALMGLASMKPQLAILVPVVLLATREWRALTAATATALGLFAVSAVLFGTHLWIAWLDTMVRSTVVPTTLWTNAGRLWGISVWACSVLLGTSRPIATALQLFATILSAAAVVVTFRRTKDHYIRLAVLLAASILAAPYCTLYDAEFLALAVLFWLATETNQRSPATWLLALSLWFIPHFSPPRVVPLGRVIPLVIGIFLWVVLAQLLKRSSAPAFVGSGDA